MGNGSNFITLVTLFVPAMIWRGYVLLLLWGWFVVPIFALPALNLPQSIGLGMVVSFLTFSQPDVTLVERTPAARITRFVLMAFLLPLVILAIGASVKQWL